MRYIFCDCMSAACFILTIVVVLASPQVTDRVGKHMQCAEFCITAVTEFDVVISIVCTVLIDVYS